MENSLHYKLRNCHTNCQKVIVQGIKHETNLKPGEPKILEYLAEHEPCEQKKIAIGCNIDSASVTGILGRMEARKLIKRETKNGNRRSLYVSRTLEGQELTEKVEQVFKLADSGAIEGISHEELNTFIKVLEKVNDNLLNILKEQTKNE